MATTNTRRRIHPGMTPAQRRRAVRAMLREFGRVLAAARRANRHVAWPAVTATRSPEPTPSAAAV